MHHRWQRRGRRRGRRPAPHIRLMMLRRDRDGWPLRLTTIEMVKLLHGHNVKEELSLREARDDSALTREGREKGWMQSNRSQSGRRGRARQQGFNILRRSEEDRQREAS